MRKIILALVLGLSLGGCALLNDIKVVSTIYANPVTKDMLSNVENGAIVVFAGLNAYKRSCYQGAVDANCRSNITMLQGYTRRLPPLLANLRKFVKTNDQINAVAIYNEIVALIKDTKATAVNAGVRM